MAEVDRSIAIRVLGTVEVVRAGEALALGGDRQRRLLALLTLDPRHPLAFDWIIDELWSGKPPPGAEVSLRSYVTRLRGVLRDSAPIRTSGHGYALDVPDDLIDSRRFQAQVHQGAAALSSGHLRVAAARLRDALELWHGRAFGDLGEDGALRIEAERLEGLRLDALEQRLEAELGLGQAAALVDELEGLVRQHPYREAFWRQLMLALYRSERQADSLATYLRAREALDEQLGVEPGPELQAMQAAILRQDVPAPASNAARNNLPAPLTTFIGRDVELGEVAALLEGARLVTLSGVGGVGKTRLALEAARRALDGFRDGALFVDLTPLAAPSLVITSLASVLDVGADAGDLAARVADHLRTREILLVLDNCEHVRDAVASLLRALLPAAPALRVIATSREVLGVAGEVTYTVPPLRLKTVQDDAGSESEAVQLFLARAREVRPSFPSDDAVVSIVGQICADLEGLPLAIELAAARTRVLSIAEIAERLADRLALLVSWRTLAPSRHRTLREALDWSFGLLMPDEQRLLGELSVFAGGFTLDAAASVCLAGYEGATLALLQRLVEASLLAVDTTLEPTRYRMLETVRQYGADRLGDRRSTIELALAAWVLSLLGRVIPDGSKPIPPATYQRLDADLDNIRAALRRAADEADPSLELAIAAGVWKYWWVRGLVGEARSLYDGIIERRGIVSSPHGLRAARAAANLAWSAGDVDRARALGERVLEAARRADNDFEQASVLNVLGIVARAQKRLEAAEAQFGEAIALARKMDNAELVAMYRGNLATVHMDAGRLNEARELLTANLEYRRPEGISDGLGYAHLNLGEVELEAGALGAAEKHFLAATEAFRKVGVRGRLANSLQGLAAVEVRTGRAEAGARHLGEAAAELGATSGWATGDSPLEGLAIEAARAALGDAGFEALFEEGRSGVSSVRA